MTAASSLRRRVAVVLAAGQGTRMRSQLPKVLHRAAGRPLIDWVLDAARGAGCEEIVVVVGHGGDHVRRHIDGSGASDVSWVVQEKQRGTGHALAQAESRLGSEPATLVVLSGDAPLVLSSTLIDLVGRAEQAWGAVAVAAVEEPGSLGRVMMSPQGHLERIVEAGDATETELTLATVNSGHYALPSPEIFTELRDLPADNAKRELYLTEALHRAVGRGEPVVCLVLGDPAEAWGVNDRLDLARVHVALMRRKIEQMMTDGVSVLAPDRLEVDANVEVGPETVLHPGVALLGRTIVGRGCELHQGAWVRDSEIESGAVIMPYSVLDGARLATDCTVGPFARLRPGSELGASARVGNFVEIKNSRLGTGAKANHHAYIGDADVGAGANIGAGTVTCNYDGQDKHRTEIGERAFIGSDTMLVAPVKIGADAVTAAGSVVTDDVPDGALAVGRARQRVILDWVRRRRRKGSEPSG